MVWEAVSVVPVCAAVPSLFGVVLAAEVPDSVGVAEVAAPEVGPVSPLRGEVSSTGARRAGRPSSGELHCALASGVHGLASPGSASGAVEFIGGSC